MTDTAFDSRKNYLKAIDTSGFVRLVTPKPSTLDVVNYYSLVTVTHGLGRRPMVRARFSPSNNNTWFPMDGEYDSSSDMMGIAGMSLHIQSITTTTVTFRAQSTSSLAGQNYTLAYKIYLDPTT